MRTLYLLKSSYLSNFFALAAASRVCRSDVSSSSSDPKMNDFRADLLRDLDDLGLNDTRGRASRKSTSGSGVSSGGEGVLAIGTPSIMTMSLRRRGEGGVPEGYTGLRDETGKVGSVADLACV
jgi:hypothetical protein